MSAVETAGEVLLRRSQVARRFAVRSEAVRYWQKVGLVNCGERIKLRGRKVGGLWRYSEADVEAFMSKLNGPAPSAPDPLLNADPSVFGRNPEETEARAALAEATAQPAGTNPTTQTPNPRPTFAG